MFLSGWILGAHLLTAHSRSGYETVTLGLYARTADGMTVGALSNSYGRASVYLGQTFSTADGRWSLTAGGITGYRAAAIMPLLVPSAKFQVGGQWDARLAYLPKQARNGGSHALHLGIERRF